MKFNHVGIPTTTRFEGEIDLPHLRVTVSDHQSNPFGIQWMRYWEDAPVPDLVKTVAHVAFEVDDLEQAVHGQEVIIPPNSFALARTVEYFRIPRNVMTICLGKSTYARCGIIVNVTPFEPEWEGYVTLEFSNTTPMPAKIYANEGVAQVLFFEADEVCEVSYKDRGGKYQGQQGVTPPKL